MSSTTQRKKKASEKALLVHIVSSLPALLAQYDDWIDAARLFDLDLMQQLHHSLMLGTIVLIRTLDPNDPRVVELKAAFELVEQMAEEVAQRLPEFMMSIIDPGCKLRFNDPQVIERLALRIERIKRLEERLSPRTEKQVIWKALGYTSGRKFDSDHPDAIKSISPKRCQARLDMFSSEDEAKILNAITAWAPGKK